MGAFLLGALLATGDAWAGSLYRCLDKNGVTAYSSTSVGYRQCKLVGSFPDAPKAASVAAGKGKTAAAGGQVEFRTAAGAAQPKTAPTPRGASAPRVSRGAVYKYVKNGVSHYTNRRPSGRHVQVLFTYIESCFACSRASAVDFQSVALNLSSYSDEVQAAALEHGVDAGLIRAIIHAESAFNPNAVSRVGAQGLMQVMSKLHHEKFQEMGGVKAALNPVANIRVGALILKDYVKRGGSVEAGLKTYVGAAAFETDSGYGSRVLAEYHRLKQVATGKKVPTFTPALRPPPATVVVKEAPAAAASEQIAGL